MTNITVELPDDCWLPDKVVDVEWFLEPRSNAPYYRPISEAGRRAFKGYTESGRYPGFYGFRTAMPHDWPKLTFAASERWEII